MHSLGAILDRHKGIGPGFDTLRLLLAFLILCWHSILVSYGREVDRAAWESSLGVVAASLLPMFFALSGFLVMGSALRTGELRKFMTLRALRIAPALATEITVSALLLGMTLTTLSVWEYVTHDQFLSYFGSLIGRVRVTLPGLFTTNPYPDVANVSLWTISPELLCYVFLAILMLVGVYRHKIGMTVVVTLLAVAYAIFDIASSAQWLLIARPTPQALLLSFAFGNLLFLWKDRIPYSLAVFIACLSVGVLLIRITGATYVALICFAYCIVFLGLTRLPRVPVLSRGDYSYGIYLYAFPMQQLVSYMLPGMREWYWNIIFAFPLTLALAMLSWTFIEKPALDLRKQMVFEKKAGSLEHAYVAKFFLLCALIAYALFLMWNANMFIKPKLTMEFLVAASLGLAAISGAIVIAMAALDRGAQRDPRSASAPIRAES